MFLHFYIMHHFLEKVNSLFQFLLIFSDRERGEGLFSHCYAVVEQLAPYDAGGDGDTSFPNVSPAITGAPALCSASPGTGTSAFISGFLLRKIISGRSAWNCTF